ncbi:MAG TPA: alanyl-tRNA editing protein [Burkholderiales bacterium]|nr:alanyl-tRNA editing protein [Burkholderiales bacterium]
MTAAAPSTLRLYLDDSHCFETDACVVAVRGDALAFDRTCCYPGGGGQPADQGRARLESGRALEIVSVQADADDVLWHVVKEAPRPDLIGQGHLIGQEDLIGQGDLTGQAARLTVDRERRLALARYHTVLHVLNTIALRDYGGWITGCQIAPDYARIDFKLDALSAELCAELERKVNAVLAADHPVTHRYLPEEEFRRRDDLLRTLEAKPPVVDGRVRVVEIRGFDAQACGGTHVRSTAELGRLTIFRTENKGRINKRLYVRLG